MTNNENELKPEFELEPTRSAHTSIHELEQIVFVKSGLLENSFDLKRHLEDTEYGLICEALAKSGSVVAQAAKILGIQRTTLIEKMKKYQIDKNNIARVVS